MKVVCFVNVVKCYFFSCINMRLGILNSSSKAYHDQEFSKCYITCHVDTGGLDVTAACELHDIIVLTIQLACRNSMVHSVTTSKDIKRYLPQNFET